MVCLPWADSDQCFNVSGAYFRWLFWMTVSDYCSRWLFRMLVSDEYSGLLFRMTIPDAYFRWLFQMTISDYCSRWIFRMLVCNSTTDSYFSDQFVFSWSIPISTNRSTDWSHDWFVFERRLPTAELWPRPPDTFQAYRNNYSIVTKEKKVFFLWLWLFRWYRMLIKILAKGWCCQKKGLCVRLFTVGKRRLEILLKSVLFNPFAKIVKGF